MLKEKRPPKPLEWLLEHILPRYVDVTALGDFEEEYIFIASERGTTHANFWYLSQIIKSIPPFLQNMILWSCVMFKNYTIIALRDFKKNKIYSFISISGLAIGMACCIVIILFVQNQLSFDRYHENGDNIYMLSNKFIINYNSREHHTILSNSSVGPNLVNDFPEVTDAVRLLDYKDMIIGYGNERLTTDILYADPNILNVFTFPLIKGDKKTALRDPNNAVISEELAERIFGTEDTIGKIITLYDFDDKYDFQITGVLKNIPYNSHFRFDFLVQYEHLKKRRPNFHSITYLLLNDNANPKELEDKFQGYISKQYQDESTSQETYFLQPLSSIHFNKDFAVHFHSNSNILISYLLSAIALVILIISCINHINLTTARASQRSREVGIRKVMGANRSQLFRQFLGESILVILVALLVAIFLASLLLPFFNSLTQRQLEINFKENDFLYIGLFLLILLTGFLSSSYPAIFLSSYQPVKVLKGDIKQGIRFGIQMRKGLIAFQFIISIVSIIGTIVIFKQLNFVSNKDLGFDKKNIIEIIIFKDRQLQKRSEMLIRELSQYPNITDINVTLYPPGRYNGFPINCVPEGFPETQSVQLNRLQVRYDFFNFFGIDIIEGRDFSKEITTDSTSSVIINESAVKKLGWGNPLGKQIESDIFSSDSNKKGTVTVIGVVKDYHNGPLYDEIKPTIYRLQPNLKWHLYLRIQPQKIQETIYFLEKKWKELPTHLPFAYSFLDDVLEKDIYLQARKISKIFTFCSILVIGLACLGLFGLVSYSSEQRKKEIGIRRVLGASRSNIIALLSKDFAVLYLTANIIAWPLGYLVSNLILQQFAYRIGLGLWVFAISAALLSFITQLTISFQSIKATTINPVDTLRHE